MTMNERTTVKHPESIRIFGGRFILLQTLNGKQRIDCNSSILPSIECHLESSRMRVSNVLDTDSTLPCVRRTGSTKPISYYRLRWKMHMGAFRIRPRADTDRIFMEQNHEMK